MDLRFEQPLWLWLLLAIVPAALLALAFFGAMSPLRRWSAVLLRAGLVALLALALAGASSVRRTDRLAVVALVDVSESVRRLAMQEDGAGVPRAAEERVREFLRAASVGRGPDDLLGLVAFDARAVAVATPTRADVTDRSLDVGVADGTNIAEAIRLGRALIPPDAAGRLVLFSDGAQTTGDALSAAAQAGASAPGSPGIPVDVVPLEYALRDEVVVEALDAPPRAAAEASVNLRLTLNATGPATGTVRLLNDGQAVALGADADQTGLRVELTPGRNTVVLPVRLDGRRLHRFRAVFEPDVAAPGEPAGDTLVENNAAESFTLTPGRGSVLVVDGASSEATPGAGLVLPGTLREAGLDVAVTEPEGMPSDLLSLQAYDLVILQNVPVEAVSEGAQEALASYVREVGGGLVMVGGPDSFGAGGWRGSTLEPLLPVRLDLPDRAVTPELAIVFVLDVSGSMNRSVLGSFRTQMQIANEAAALAVRSLDRGDLVGVITFNREYDVLVPLGPNARREETVERILDIDAGGGTNGGPAMEEGGRMLARAEAKQKHLIYLSDGRDMGAERLPEIAERLQGEGVTVSTIAVGDAADLRTMAEMATRGGGTYYNVVNANVLPRVFLRAVRVTRAPLVREEVFTPRVLPVGSPLTIGLPELPPLGGLSLTRARTEPGVTTAVVSPQGEPVVAHWNVELGRVAAFTSDAHRWAREWIDTPAYRAFWVQVARTMSRPPAARSMAATAEASGGVLRVRLEAQDDRGRPRDFLTVPATVHAPSGETEDVLLTQVGPGRYEATRPLREPGSHVVVIKPQQGRERLEPVVVGAAAPAGAELRTLESDRVFLERVAQASGGRVLSMDDPAGAALFERRGVTAREALSGLWRPLLVAALVVFLLDVATRRIAWDRWVSGRYGAGLARAAAEAVRDRSGEATRVVDALRTTAAREPAPVRLGAGGGERFTLGDDDARALAQAAADRRRAARLAALRGGAGDAAAEGGERAPSGATATRPLTPAAMDGPRDTPAPTPAADAGDAPERAAASGAPAETDGPGPGGLLGAKRRARERYKDGAG